MAATLSIQQILKINGLAVEGSPAIEQDLDLTTGQVFQVLDKVISDNYGYDTLWSSGDGGLDTFTQGFLYSDQDLLVELVTTGPTYCLLTLPANVLTPVPAACLGSTSESFGSGLLESGTDFFPTTGIKVQRNVADGVGDAAVDLFLFA